MQETGYGYSYEERTVQDVLKQWGSEMAQHGGIDASLTLVVGKYIQSLFGWESPVALGAPVVAGTYKTPGIYDTLRTYPPGTYSAPGET